MAEGKILVVDDEEDILELVRFNLEREGYTVLLAETGEKCLFQTRKHLPSLVILDLMLPGIDGHDVCKQLKADNKTAHIPVLMLTAKSDDSDVVTGLELGADDYVTKPFSPKVLLARVKNLLKRASGKSEAQAESIIRGGLVINPARREIFVDGEMVDLTFTEFEILKFLAAKPGLVFTRSQIVNGVKGASYPVTERSVDVQIVSLRKKLAGVGRNIETVRGVGYKYRD